MIKVKKKPSVAAVLLAGGKGERMGGRFKQFLKISGKPILFYSLEKFIANKFINEVIVVVPEQKIGYAKNLIEKKLNSEKVRVISCEKTRKLSSSRILFDFKKKGHPPDYVIFHDAARPAISEHVINSVVREAFRCGGAVAAGRAPDLILEADDKHIRRAIPKETAYCGFTPQCFRFKELYEAHKKSAGEKTFDSSDNIELLKYFSPKFRILLIESEHPIHKITFQHDIAMVKQFLKN
ncbi:MAG: 2-C-methyl-D-erythritol 4-phosphate cytidylyltransferase [Candidatus Azambacteria bacterium]|nr:2-C-methyl-D-erythritol 4-phosphate cytidylyltransferase [Candidatus Azambacteria bacterium]